MGIFNPTVTGSVGFEQPVGGRQYQGGSTGLGIAQLGVGVLEAIVPTQKEQERAARRAYTGGGGGGFSSSKSKPNLIPALQDGLLKVNQLRNEERFDEAEALETTVINNFLRLGGKWNSTEKAVVEGITGQSFDEVLRSPAALQLEEIQKSEDFQAFYAAADKGLSAEERRAWALGKYQAKAAREAALFNDSLEFSGGKREILLSQLKDQQEMIAGFLANSETLVGPKEIGQLELEWQSERARLIAEFKTEGVTDEQWEPVEAYLNSVDTSLEIIKKQVSAEGLRADNLSILLQSMPETMTPGERIIAEQVLDVKNIIGLGDAGSTGMLRDVLRTVIGIPGRVTPETQAEDDQKASEGTATSNFNSVEGITRTLRGVDRARLQSDNKYADEFARLSTAAMSNLRELALGKGQFVSARTVDNTFDGSIIGSIVDIGKTDPTLAKTLLAQGRTAIKGQMDVVSAQISNSIRGTAYSFENGEIVFNEGKAVELVGAERLGILRDAANRLYGGNLDTLLQDSGALWFSQTTDTSLGMPFSEAVDAIKTLQTNSQFEGQLSSYNALTAADQRFTAAGQNLFSQKTQDKPEAVSKTELTSRDNTSATPWLDGGDFGQSRFDGYINSMIKSESGGRSNAKNPSSSATGLAQFIDSTWREMMRKHPDLGLTADGRTDPEQSRRAAVRFTEDNMKVLEARGIPVNEGSLYAAHFLGAGGAVRAYSGANEDSIANHVTPGVMKANPFLKGMTVADFKQWAFRKGTAGKGAPPVTISESSSGTGGKSVKRADNDLSYDLVQAAEVTIGPDSLMDATGMIPPDTQGVLRATGGQPSPETPVQTSSIAPVQIQREDEIERDRSPGEALAIQQHEKVLAVLEASGVDTKSIPIFNSAEEAQKAIDEGIIGEGNLYIVDNEVEVVGKP